MSYVVCAYFTEDKIYRNHASNLIKSLKKFNLPYEVTPITSFNNWHKGMQYKPTFLLEMLSKYSDHSIVYVDVDAVCCKYPQFFDTLDKEMPEVNIAVHVLDHTKYHRKHCAPELLSGTIFLRNSRETSIIVQEWILELERDPKLWDQRALDKVLKNYAFYNLPEEYCVIYDYMATVLDPVIKHFQASREVKRAQVQKSKRRKPRVKIIENNSVIKLGRIHK